MIHLRWKWWLAALAELLNVRRRKRVRMTETDFRRAAQVPLDMCAERGCGPWTLGYVSGVEQCVRCGEPRWRSP